MNEYNNAQIDYRERCKARIQRQLEISKFHYISILTGIQQYFRNFRKNCEFTKNFINLQNLPEKWSKIEKFSIFYPTFR